MKNLKKVLALTTAIAAAAFMITGCGSSGNDAAGSTAASEQTSAAAESSESALKQVKLVAHTSWGEDQNFIVNYDEEGRIISMGCYIDTDEAPADKAEDDTLYVDYTSGKAEVNYNSEILAALSQEDIDYPTVQEVTTYDNGSPKYVFASHGTALKFEFDENGLPVYCSQTQDMGDYAIGYGQDESGRFIFTGAIEENPGHFDGASGEDVGVNVLDASAFEGEVIYW